MPSPFPGMDPYLENSRFGQGFHKGSMAQTMIALNALLPPRYATSLEERVYVTGRDSSVVADVAVSEQRGRVGQMGGSSATAVADPPLTRVLEAEEVHEAYVEIVTVDRR